MAGSSFGTILKLQHGANPTGRDSALWWMDVLPDCLLMKMTFRNF